MCIRDSLDAIDKLRFLIIPNGRVISPEAANKIEAFVRAGGWLWLEGDADSFVQQGFFRYPDERPFVNGLGFEGLGERHSAHEGFTLEYEGGRYQLSVKPGELLVPYHVPQGGSALACAPNDEAIVVMAPYGQGRVICCGQLLGKTYYHEAYSDFERLLKAIAGSAGALPAIRVETQLPLQWRYGTSGEMNLLFLINSSDAQTVEINLPAVLEGKVSNLANGEDLPARPAAEGWKLSMDVERMSYNILCWRG